MFQVVKPVYMRRKVFHAGICNFLPPIANNYILRAESKPFKDIKMKVSWHTKHAKRWLKTIITKILAPSSHVPGIHLELIPKRNLICHFFPGEKADAPRILSFELNPPPMVEDSERF